MKVEDILKKLKDDGWFQVRSKGAHIQLKHEVKSGRVTVPYHGRNEEIPKGTLNSIIKQARLK